MDDAVIGWIILKIIAFFFYFVFWVVVCGLLGERYGGTGYGQVANVATLSFFLVCVLHALILALYLILH